MIIGIMLHTQNNIYIEAHRLHIYIYDDNKL